MIKKIEKKLNSIINTRIVYPILMKKIKYGSIHNKKYNKNKVVCSLTTVPERISLVHYSIQSMLYQTITPDKIVLYLDKDKFKSADLPNDLKKLMGDIFEIQYVKDVRVHTKYYYAFKEFSDSLIITTDDDVIYSSKLIEQLLKKHEKYPNDVICSRAHKILVKSDKYLPYNEWLWDSKSSIPTDELLATGVGGVLYNPASFKYSPCNEKEFLKLAPNQDDLWLKAIEYVNGIKVCTLKGKHWFSEIKDSQNVRLGFQNVDNNKNDECWKILVKKFNILI